MKKDNIDFLGFTSLDDINKADYTEQLLLRDTDLFFTKRKSPSIKYITKMVIDFYTTNNSIFRLKDYKLLTFDGVKKYTIEFIDNENKRSTLNREYPLLITVSIPNNVSNYKLYLIDASIYPLEKRVVKAYLQFMLCFSYDIPNDSTTTKKINDPINVSSEDKNNMISDIKEIFDIDEEFM